MRRSRRVALQIVVTTLLAASGCDRAPRPPADDSAVASVPSPGDDTAGAEPSLNGWNPAAGPALLVAGDAAQSASAIFPQPAGELADTTRFDESAVTGIRVDLFSPVGMIGQGTVADGFDSGTRECVAWPTVRIVPDAQVPAGASWTIALRAGTATALPARSAATMSRADSAALSREVLRLASLVPSDPSQPFHGLPFAARTILRFEAEPGTEALVADIVRRISTEADPREEHTLIVAERDSASPGRFELVYHERTAGPEETVVASDALAALVLGADSLPTLVLRREDGAGTVYALLERTRAGQWRVRWTSAHAGC